MFYCDIEPGEDCGGLTPIARNSEVFAKLDPKVVQKLEEKKVRYSRYLPSTGIAHAQYVTWQSSFYTEDPKVTFFYITNPAGLKFKLLSSNIQVDQLDHPLFEGLPRVRNGCGYLIYA